MIYLARQRGGKHQVCRWRNIKSRAFYAFKELVWLVNMLFSIFRCLPGFLLLSCPLYLSISYYLHLFAMISARMFFATATLSRRGVRRVYKCNIIATPQRIATHRRDENEGTSTSRVVVVAERGRYANLLSSR